MADEKTPEQLQQEMFDTAVTAVPEAEPTATPPEAPAEPEPKQGEPPPTPPVEPPEAAIPSWRLREEAEARRLAEDRARMLEARLNEVAAHIQRQQKQPDFFENPDEATQALILRTLQPYAEEQRKQTMYNSQLIAKAVHGAERVDEAERAFLEAREREALDPADYERVVQSPNRYDAVVQWHKRQSVLASVGDDPEAWFQKRLEAAMDDPKVQAKFIERTQKGAASRPSETRLPPSLSRTTAAASNAGEPLGDMSDASLFKYAMSPRKG
jgi:hypothetical protein